MDQLQHVFCKETPHGQSLLAPPQTPNLEEHGLFSMGWEAASQLTRDLCLWVSVLGAKARSTQARKIVCVLDTDPVSPGNGKLNELRALETENLFLAAKTDLNKAQHKTPSTGEIYLSNKPWYFLSQASYVPDSALKYSDPSVWPVPPAQPWYSPSPHHWHESSCPRSLLVSLCMPANEKPQDGCRWCVHLLRPLRMTWITLSAVR